jgi:hypothetical protein
VGLRSDEPASAGELQRFDMREWPRVGKTRDTRDRCPSAEIQEQPVGDESASGDRLRALQNETTSSK